jgi:hypothetical protein
MANTRSVFAVAYHHVQANQQVTNVLMYKTVLNDNTTLPTNFMFQFATHMASLWNLWIRPFVSAQLVHFQTQVVEITGWQVVPQPGDPPQKVVLSFGDQRTNNDYLGTPGAVAGDPMPTTVPAVINLRTGLAGRRNRGRIKQGGLLEVDNDATGRVSATARGVIDAAYINLKAPLIPSTPVNQVELSVFSQTKLLTQTPNTNIRLAAEIVTEIVTSPIWGSQRSRRQRDGGF